MGSVLHAVGAFSVRRRWLVVTVWLALLTVVGASAAAFQQPADDSFSIPGTASVDTLERLGEAFPAAGGASGQVVIAAPEGGSVADGANAAAIMQAVAGLNAIDGVARASDPFESMAVSQDLSIAYISVNYFDEMGEISEDTLEQSHEAVAPVTDAGMRAEFAGDAYRERSEPGGLGEALGVMVAMVVLYVTLRAVVAAALPLVTAIAAVGLGVGGVYALTGSVELPSSAPILALMLGLAVGIDYSLFILARHRAQLIEGMAVRDSIARANGTAGAAVVFAGATVIVALLALVMADIPFLTAMGNAAAATVAIAVLAALTLLPAVMSFAGLKVLPKKVRAQVAAGPADVVAEPSANRWVEFVTRRPVWVLAAGIAALAVVAVPAADLRLGLPSDQSEAEESSARQAYDLLAEGFGPGFNGPIVMLGETANPETGAADVAATASAVGELANVVFVSPPIPSPDGGAYLIQVIPGTGPDAVETEDLVHAIREIEPAGDATFGVTGTTAIKIDVAEGIQNALPGYLAVVVGLALILLLLVFRSVLIPVKALLGFLLTLAATTGAVVAVFQWGWLADLLQVEYTGPIVAFLPIIGIGITFGLAMDYEVFLVSRMREEHLAGAEPKRAIVVGFSHSARVVTAAALIMSSVFLGFILDDDVVIKSMGFALAFAVLIDAFVVRMTLVPAAMALMGKAAWWLPRWLDRVVPEIHLEGDPEDVREPAPKVLVS
jgi:RND superfamily putative drug exporter